MNLTFHSCATVAAPKRLVDKNASWKLHDFPIRYGILEHPQFGLILIDTGYSDALFQSRDPHVMIYRNLLRPKLLVDSNPLEVIKALGASSGDVRHVVLTHLHADHMCGLERFPRAHIHASALSLGGWQNPAHFVSPLQGFFRVLLPDINERHAVAMENASQRILPWGGRGHDLFGDGSIMAVDLPGHMPGHIGLFFPKLTQPLFFAADADWTYAGLEANTPPPWPARMIVADLPALQSSLMTVKKAKDQGYKIALCHDEAP